MGTRLPLVRVILAQFSSMTSENLRKRFTNYARAIRRPSILWTSRTRCRQQESKTIRWAWRMAKLRQLQAHHRSQGLKKSKKASSQWTRSRRRLKSLLKRKSKRIWKNYRTVKIKLPLHNRSKIQLARLMGTFALALKRLQVTKMQVASLEVNQSSRQKWAFHQWL